MKLLNKFTVTKYYDDKARIIKITHDGNPPLGYGFSGHSVCNECGKDMPKCWDTVCYKCNRTFCYNHSIDINNKWYCLECAVKESQTSRA